MPFPFSVPAKVTALAERRALGARRAVFPRRRALLPAALWPVTVLVLTIAIVLALIAGQHVVALALIGALLAGIALARYVAAGGAVVYEHGLVYALGRRLRSVRWDEARFCWLGVADLAILPRDDALPDTLPPDGARPAGGVADASPMTGTDGRLIVRGVSGIDRLQQLVDAELAPRALARGQAQLAAGSQADYPPLAITRTGLFARRTAATDKAPWAAVDSYQRIGGRLVINAFVDVPGKGRVVKQWFQGLVADATAAEQLMDATDPDPGTSRAAAATENAARDLAAQLRQRALRRRRILRQAIPFTVLVAGAALITLIHPAVNGLGYAGVCGGGTAPQAAAYAGGGPHPIDFEGGSGGFGGVPDNAGVLPGESPDWIPASAADVQLVACVTGTQTPNEIANCEYTTTNVPMDDEQYTITVYAAQTRAQVVAPQTIDGDDSTCPDSVTTTNGQGPSAFYSTLTADAVDSVVDSAVSSPAS